MTTQRYETACQALFAQAEAELAAGDARQAAEKGWGAAAQAVKAVCESRGWEHHSHNLIRRAVKQISVETGDENLRPLFNSAQTLHKNFYEDFYNVEEVGDALVEVRRFIDKLDALYKAGGSR